MREIRLGKLQWQQAVVKDLPHLGQDFFFNPHRTFLEVPSSQWFTRVWVLQEVALARQAVLSSQTTTIPVSSLASALHLYDVWVDWNPKELVNEQARRNYGYCYMTEEKLNHVRKQLAYQEPPTVSLWKLFSATTAPKSPWPPHTTGTPFTPPTLLASLIMIFVMPSPGIRLEATNPLDRIYGLLDITRDASALGILPDYNKSVEALFTQVASNVLKTGNLEILLYCRGRSLPGLPTWVPGWTAEIQAPWSANGISRADGCHTA
ncbi:hypothetical protein P154DRAFT_612079, partial [Amniculicola lignicola CBS 123094]